MREVRGIALSSGKRKRASEIERREKKTGKREGGREIDREREAKED